MRSNIAEINNYLFQNKLNGPCNIIDDNLSIRNKIIITKHVILNWYI